MAEDTGENFMDLLDELDALEPVPERPAAPPPARVQQAPDFSECEARHFGCGTIDFVGARLASHSLAAAKVAAKDVILTKEDEETEEGTDADSELPELIDEDDRIVEDDLRVPCELIYEEIPRWSAPRSCQQSQPMGRDHHQEAELPDRSEASAPSRQSIADSLDAVLARLNEEEAEEITIDRPLRLGAALRPLDDGPALRPLDDSAAQRPRPQRSSDTASDQEEAVPSSASLWRQRKKKQMEAEQVRRRNRESDSQATVNKAFFRHQNTHARSVLPQQLREADAGVRPAAAFGWAGGVTPIRSQSSSSHVGQPSRVGLLQEPFFQPPPRAARAPVAPSWNGAPPARLSQQRATVEEACPQTEEAIVPSYDELMAQLDMLEQLQ